jgi:hypothetical protein
LLGIEKRLDRRDPQRSNFCEKLLEWQDRVVF